MNPNLRRVLIVLVLLVLAAAVAWWLTRPKPVPVVLKSAEAGRVEATVSNTRAGTVEACQRTKMSTIMGGRIEYLGVKEGDRVKKGQVLMRLWNEDQQAQLELARAQLETTRRRVTEACTVAANAEREAQRIAELREKGFVSISREEQARADAQARAAACAAAQADVRTAEARIRATSVEQRRTVLVAPFDGTVAKIVGELGEFSTPSPPGVPTPPAIDLIDTSCLYVKAPMDEVDAPRIRAGQPVRITLDAVAGKSFPATVKRVAPYVQAVEKQARTVDVEVNFDKPEDVGTLLVGYSADVEIILDVRDNVLRVPTAALKDGKRLLAYREADGTLEERTVKTGVSNWEYTEITDGLAKGERFVTSLEREGVKAGASVSPEAGKDAAPANAK